MLTVYDYITSRAVANRGDHHDFPSYAFLHAVSLMSVDHNVVVCSPGKYFTILPKRMSGNILEFQDLFTLFIRVHVFGNRLNVLLESFQYRMLC